jgi:hypothetical protein
MLRVDVADQAEFKTANGNVGRYVRRGIVPLAHHSLDALLGYCQSSQI